jgi:hypothetical protein
MLIYYLTVAMRNLGKYKAQNIINCFFCFIPKRQSW